jgi:hypothetical protein
VPDPWNHADYVEDSVDQIGDVDGAEELMH